MRLAPQTFFELSDAVGSIGSFIANNAYDLDPEKLDSVVHNSLSEWAREHEEEWKEDLPIYRTKESQEFGWHSFLDAGFWTEDALGLIPTVLSLMVPAMGAGRAAQIGITKGAKLASKAVRKANIANKTGTATGLRGLEGLRLGNLGKLANASTAAVVSRTAEGAMEAHETYQQTYQEALNDGLDHVSAQSMASQAAADTYKFNYLLTFVDLFQYHSILSGFNKAGSAWGKAARNLQDAGAFKKAMNSSRGLLANMGAEAFEEVYQLGAGQYSKDRILGKVDNTTKSWMDGIASYMIKSLGTSEGLKAATLGAMGGGFFHGFGKEQLGQNKEEDL